jgi:enamine deaminase RidA (YjgF/YER057c/UK114 family)
VAGELSRHTLVSPGGLPSARGFSYGVISAPGRLLHLAGITGEVAGEGYPGSLVDQFSNACRGVAAILEEAGGVAGDLVSMTIFVTDVPQYLANLEMLGSTYRAVFGKHYPAMALIGVDRLFDEGALVEVQCVAVLAGGE